MSQRLRKSRRASERGFSLIELVISLLIAIEILVAAALAFDVHNRMASIQVQITDMQQSMRVAQYDIVRHVRMAGRGGLPAEVVPSAIYATAAPVLNGLAVEVRNNVEDDARAISRDDADSPDALPLTDILTVRGCFGGSIFQINPEDFDWDPDANDIADTSTIEIPEFSIAGLPQPYDSILEQIQDAEGSAEDLGGVLGRLVIVSTESLQKYGIANITGYEETPGDDSTPGVLTLTLRLDTGSPLNPIDPDTDPPVRRFIPEMDATLACYLEEHRYYVRDVDGDAITPKKPRLARARFEPGTELPYLADDANYSLDVADNIIDLQVALGFDSDYFEGYVAGSAGSFGDDTDWLGVDDLIYEADRLDDAADPSRDDWLFNWPADRVADTQYTLHANTAQAGLPVQLHYVRVSTVARTARPDPSYDAPDMDIDPDGEWVEDHDFTDVLSEEFVVGNGKKHRRRVLTTMIEMRNI